jgi:hypothetical protein
MAFLARHLRTAGHAPELFGYAGWASSYDAIRHRLAARLTAVDTGEAPWVAVGHSLGGLLLRDAIATATPTHLVHLVMLATPNQLPRLAPRARRVAPFRWFTGECGARLASPDYFVSLPVPTVPHTIIAGTRGITGRWSPFGDEPNDGVVAVRETLLDPGVLPRTVRAAHTFIMNNAEVQAVILEILARHR